MKKISTWNKIAIIVLAFSLVLGAVAVTYAAYTNSQRAQRTIATYDPGGVRFSSNYLKNMSSSDNVRTLYVTSSASKPSAIVTVCNYQQNKQTATYDKNITYDITVRLVKYDDSEDKYDTVDAAYISDNSLTGYTVDVKKGSDPATTIGGATVQHKYEDCTLTAGSAHSDTFSLTFSTNFAENQPNLYVEMIAEPKGDSALPTLRGIFKTGLRAEGISNNWTGEFTDSTSYDPDDYDGFNYTVSGMGSGTFTLKWDSTKVVLSHESLLQLLAIDGASQSGDSITFAVNSDEAARYDLQFYKVDVADMEWGDMNEVLSGASSSITSDKAVGYFFTAS